MDKHRLRNLIPPIYAALIIGGFLISATVGVVVLIVGGSITGLLWSALSRGARPAAASGPPAERAAARAARRADRR